MVFHISTIARTYRLNTRRLIIITYYKKMHFNLKNDIYDHKKLFSTFLGNVRAIHNFTSINSTFTCTEHMISFKQYFSFWFSINDQMNFNFPFQTKNDQYSLLCKVYFRQSLCKSLHICLLNQSVVRIFWTDLCRAVTIENKICDLKRVDIAIRCIV